MASSRWPAVVDALVSVMRARSGFRDPASTTAPASSIPVYHSYSVGLTAEQAVAYLVVGRSGERSDSGGIRQSRATIGKVTRDEVGVIRCRAVAQTGDAELPDPSSTTSDVFAVLASVESALRTDPTLGLGASPRLVVEVNENLDVRSYAARGCVTELDFVVTYSARI